MKRKKEDLKKRCLYERRKREKTLKVTRMRQETERKDLKGNSRPDERKKREKTLKRDAYIQKEREKKSKKRNEKKTYI